MKTILLCLSCLLFSSWTFSPATVKLEYVFKVGDEYTMDQSTKQTMKQTIMGTDQTGENEYSGTMLLKIVSLTPNGAKIETQFLTLKNASKNMMGETVMDSEGKEDNTQNKIFKAMMKKPFHITMTRTGKVEKVEGAENLWSDMEKLGIDEATMAAMKPALNQMMGENSLKSSFEQALVTYPENKVQIGDTWSSTTGLAMGFPVEVANTWKLANRTSTQAVVNSNGIFTTMDKTKTVDLPGGFKATVDLNGTQDVQASVIVGSGWPEKMNIKSELKGKMTLLAGGMLPQDMEVPMEVKTETLFKIVKKK